MKQETKYYTPDHSEFCEGLEYEAYISARKCWSEETFFLNQSHLDLTKCSDIRVKYLDRADIEDCGWEFKSTNKMRNWYTGAKEWFNAVIPDDPGSRYWEFELMHDPKLNTVMIKSRTSTGEWETFFNGIINNKSELKQIMKQLGIC